FVPPTADFSPSTTRNNALKSAISPLFTISLLRECGRHNQCTGEPGLAQEGLERSILKRARESAIPCFRRPRRLRILSICTPSKEVCGGFRSFSFSSFIYGLCGPYCWLPFTASAGRAAEKYRTSEDQHRQKEWEDRRNKQGNAVIHRRPARSSRGQSAQSQAPALQGGQDREDGRSLQEVAG